MHHWSAVYLAIKTATYETKYMLDPLPSRLTDKAINLCKIKQKIVWRHRRIVLGDIDLSIVKIRSCCWLLATLGNSQFPYKARPQAVYRQSEGSSCSERERQHYSRLINNELGLCTRVRATALIRVPRNGIAQVCVSGVANWFQITPLFILIKEVETESDGVVGRISTSHRGRNGEMAFGDSPRTIPE